jgi:DNA replication protein DnaC
MLVDREYEERSMRSLQRRLQVAKLRYQASLEDLEVSKTRGLDQSLILSLASCAWIRERNNVLITGATGVGKSYLACALGHRACLEGYRVAYLRTPRLFRELAEAKGDGRFAKLLERWKKTDLLIFDDWGITPLSGEHCRDLLEILEDRYLKASTVVTSQIPFDHWHKSMKSPTLADAILDRLCHNAYRIVLKGESRRKTKNMATDLPEAHSQAVPKNPETP